MTQLKFHRVIHLGSYLSQMKKIVLSVFLLLTALFLPVMPLHASARVHHEIKVILDPESSYLEVEDRIILPASIRPERDGLFHFTLHEGLSPESTTAGVRIERVPNEVLPLSDKPPSTLSPDRTDLPVAHYTMKLPLGLRTFQLKYQGEINHPPTGPEGEAGKERTTPGTISPEGVFLSGESFWLPRFSDDLLTFNLSINLPQGWNAVSQGERTVYRTGFDSEGLGSGPETVRLRWESPEPQEEVFIVAGQWTEYSRNAGRVLAMVFLRTPDQDLADKYLEVTEQYLKMYQALLGPYPYQKFALVENFWETGYGMPSFALLGPKVIRFPFILHSSFPHEILHNWWGNGVYVDQSKGNWSEGLTSYLADFLIQEGQGKGLASRRASLQKYANYVSAGLDFPLTRFRGRHDAATQAVGYGKTLFLFHMLRRELGDTVFVQALRTFFQDHRFKRASFGDLQQAFSRTSGRDLSSFFEQWVERSGAPILRVDQVRSELQEGQYHLSARIRQRQSGPPYALQIPVAITLQGRAEGTFERSLTITEKEQEISVMLPARPIRMTVDPAFDLFRRLHPAEMPPSLSKVLGSESILIVLPKTAPEKLRQAYLRLAESWQMSRPTQIEIVWDRKIEDLPNDRDIWLFGWENRFQHTILSQLRPFGLSTNSAMTRIKDEQIPRRGHSLVLAARHPQRSRLSLNWLATDHPASLPGLERKLPHYGPFGYLGFSGNAPQNIVRGRWPLVGSPMSVRVTQGDGKWIKAKKMVLKERKALATLTPLFSKARMQADISALSDPGMKGRGFGTGTLDRVAEYIASAFRGVGLKPGGRALRSYIQQWKGKGRGLGEGLALKNVVGILPGSDPELGNESIVIGAHYDHLGFGWPRVHAGDEGLLHPGANANASGVALLIELARVLAKSPPLKRTLVFVAFTGKELDLRGSKHFVSEGRPFPSATINGMINLDAVGRLSSRPLLVLGGESAREWAPLLREAGVASGVDVSPIPGSIGESDQLSFIEKGIPAIQFFSGDTADLDRPGDTVDKIDLAGMIKTARVVKEIIEVLAARPERLNFTPIRTYDPERMWQRREKLQ